VFFGIEFKEFALIPTVKRLLEAYFTGFGISTAVSLFVIPFSSRDLMKMRMMKVVGIYKAVLEAQTEFIHSIPRREWYRSEEGSKAFESGDGGKDSLPDAILDWPEAHTLNKVTIEAAEGTVEVQTEVRYAKREFAWGKLGTKDYGKLYALLKGVLLPLLGLESIVEITDRIEKRGAWRGVNPAGTSHSSMKPRDSTIEEKEKNEWIWLFEKLHGPAEQLKQAMIEGIDHASHTLEITKRPNSALKADVESKGSDSLNKKECATHLEQSIRDFLQQREGPLREWCTNKGMDDPSDLSSPRHTNHVLHQRHQSQLYLVLDVSTFVRE
jgi:hypothetical protein